MFREDDGLRSITCSAPVNIAVIKYWGKRDEILILPTNSSVSVTLSQHQLRAKTTVAACRSFQEDKLWLNGREEKFNTRIENLLNEVKSRAKPQREKSEIREKALGKKGNKASTDGLLSWKLHICSENNFPTAAGLASSAAGYACLAYALAQLYGVTGDISDIARQGSGSACRSIPGGFVVWDKGEKEDGTDSVARQIVPCTHWLDLRILILVVSDQKKHTGSTEGMESTVNTSRLFEERLRCVPESVEQITKAILEKDFQTFAELTMKDSNQLHAVCLDTYPPISYMTDVSRQIVALIHAFNKFHRFNKVAYTFDAGPNACLYLLKQDVPMVTAIIRHFFPPLELDTCDFLSGLPIETVAPDKDFFSSVNMSVQAGAIKYMIHTEPGPGPHVLTDYKECLLNAEGLPLDMNKSVETENMSSCSPHKGTEQEHTNSSNFKKTEKRKTSDSKCSSTKKKKTRLFFK